MKKTALAFFVFSFFVAALHANTAQIKSFRGDVVVKSAGKKGWSKAVPGQKIRRNDRVHVKGGAVAQLEFASGAMVLVKENSRFSLLRYKNNDMLSFAIGEFLIGLKRKLKKDEKFRVRTPAAVAAVRGTVFWGKSDDLQTSRYACLTGSIDIWAKNKTVTLKPGQQTAIDMNYPPLDPSESNIPADFIKTFEVDGSLQGMDELIAAESAPQ